MISRTYSITEWCKIFGIELIDNDGFYIDIHNASCRMEFFLDGILECTIRPTNKDKYAVMNALLGINRS